MTRRYRGFQDAMETGLAPTTSQKKSRSFGISAYPPTDLQVQSSPTAIDRKLHDQVTRTVAIKENRDEAKCFGQLVLSSG